MKVDIAYKYAKDVAVSVMEHSGYKATIMAAAKLRDNGHVHALPPGRALPVVPIHCLPGCPDNWVRESGSYVVPVTADIGLWFDWTMNDSYNVAVVPSVKGMNPITGQKLEGCQMEHYRDTCPIHKTPFAHGRYCEECKYSWPPQNYVSTPNTLWWDGFFQSDGTVRQFFYTEDEQKDVATALIGKPNTMPAFGFAFFKYKHERPAETYRTRSMPEFLYTGNTLGLTKGGNSAINCFDSDSVTKGSQSFKKVKPGSGHYKCGATKGGTKGGGSSAGQNAWGYGDYESVDSIEISCLSASAPGASADGWQNRVSDSFNETPMSHNEMLRSAVNYSADNIKVLSEDEGRALRPEMYERETMKEVSIGAGAAITQSLSVDTRPLADYHAEPQALLRIYFCFENQFKDIIDKGGIKKLEQQKNGFLQGVPVGG